MWPFFNPVRPKWPIFSFVLIYWEARIMANMLAWEWNLLIFLFLWGFCFIVFRSQPSPISIRKSSGEGGVVWAINGWRLTSRTLFHISWAVSGVKYYKRKGGGENGGEKLKRTVSHPGATRITCPRMGSVLAVLCSPHSGLSSQHRA